MFTYDRIQLPYDNTAVTRIDTLQREGLLTRDLTDILHALRKARNKAVHENYDSESECKILLQMAYSLCEWFMQTYGDWNYQHHDFIMPELENKRVSVTQEEKAAEERQAEELILNGISKATDPGSGGRHMSNHFAKPEWHIENISSATGTHDLHAAGVARAMVYYDHKGVVITSHGESASSEGFVYEAVNGASLERLPVIFVWQDNGYGISVPKKDQTAARKVADNFSGFKNLKIIHCNGKDVFDSMNAMTEAREYALLNRNPVIVHANCVRIGSHSNSDKDTLYRDVNELAYVKEADPLLKFRRMLLRYKRLTEEELKEIEEKAKKDLAAANRKALTAPDPDPKTIFNYVLPEPYEPEKYKDGTHCETEGEKKFFVTAINETMKAEFRHNPDTFIWGQDVANRDKGGVFNVTKGMQQEFGEARVFSAPIAEDYIVGTANGMSRFDPKIRVVIEGAEFADYFWPAVEQYVECTHEYWRSNGQFVPNVTLRLASGGYIGGGLYHSQNLELSLIHI